MTCVAEKKAALIIYPEFIDRLEVFKGGEEYIFVWGLYSSMRAHWQAGALVVFIHPPRVKEAV